MPGYLQGLESAAPAIAMIAAFLLLFGAARLWRRERRKAVLMIAMALVLMGNVAIWTL